MTDDRPSLLDVLHQERKRRTTKTALVIQGGAMRGIYSMAALMALEELHLTHAFDHVFGASAGAINAAYFLAGQAKLAVTVYLDDISNKNFVDFKRLNKVVDIDFLIDHALKNNKALDISAVRASRSVLHIVLTNAVTGEAEVVTNRDDIDFMEVLRATAAMPMLYNRAVQVGEKRFIDGGVADEVPALRALESGCDEVLVVLTRPIGFRRKRRGRLQRAVIAALARGQSPAVKRKLAQNGDFFNSTMDALEGKSPIDPSVRMLVVYPRDLDLVASRTCRDRDLLLETALMARNDMRRALGVAPIDASPF